MKILVCGCSYFTQDTKYPSTHFSELLAKKLNAQLVPLAVAGASNFIIRLQIQESLTIKPDLVILGFTSPERMEFKLYEHAKYNAYNGVHNIKYRPNSPYIKEQYACIGSMPIPSLMYTDNYKDLFKLYLTSPLHIPAVSHHKELFIAESGLNLLQDNNIPFVYTIGGLGPDLNILKNYNAHKIPDIGNPWIYQGDEAKYQNERAYNTSDKRQIDLLYIWLKKIKELYNFV